MENKSSVIKQVQEKMGHKENTLEYSNHLDVSKLMEEKNAFFVHMIQVTDQLNVSEKNKSVDTRKLSVTDKLDLLCAMNPTLSVSTIRPGIGDKTFHGGFGVIFSHGEIEHASTNDDDTVAVAVNERYVIGGAKNSKEDISRAIDRDVSGNYNELVLRSPEVAGGFMKLESFKDRITYTSEQIEYFDGEKTTTQVGIIDFSNPLDRRGRPTGESYDKPLSVLFEMSERGKVFVMDEKNQMYIVRSIDSAARKVEFVASPITPKDFAFHYGSERMNKYQKQEIKERLEKSLQEKGIEIH